MNFKRIIGFIVFIAGIALVIFSIYYMEKKPEAKGLGQEVGDFFTKNPMWNPMIKFFGGTPQVKPIDSHTSQIVALIIGLILAIFGGFTAFKRRSRWL